MDMLASLAEPYCRLVYSQQEAEEERTTALRRSIDVDVVVRHILYTKLQCPASIQEHGVHTHTQP